MNLQVFRVGPVQDLKVSHQVNQLFGGQAFAIFHFHQDVGALVQESGETGLGVRWR